MTRGKRHIRKNRSKAATTVRRQRWRGVLSRITAIAAVAVGIPLLGLGCTLAHDILTQGGYLRIRYTEITGLKRLSREEILRQAAVPGALNLLGVNLGIVRERLMAHPWVADASVARRFPDRLEIRIREERPMVQVTMEDQWYLVNADGVFFAAGEAPEPGIPAVTGITAADLDAEGRLPSAVWRQISAATGYLAATQGAPDGREIRRITYDRDIGVSVQGPDALGLIRLGETRAAEAVAVTERIAAYLSSSGRASRLAAIDMHNPKRIVVTPAPAFESREETHEENKHAA